MGIGFEATHIQCTEGKTSSIVLCRSRPAKVTQTLVIYNKNINFNTLPHK